MPVETTTCLRTLRLKVKSEGYRWLNAAASEVNQVWNFANVTSEKGGATAHGTCRTGHARCKDVDVR
jgi:hypothetical protein